MAQKHQLSLSPINIGAFFNRFHAIIFAITVCGSLTIAVFLLTTILNSSSTPDGYVPPSTNTSFDSETIERVEKLRPLSSPPTSPILPEGRTDPFPQ